jgi:hypothetical protein
MCVLCVLDDTQNVRVTKAVSKLQTPPLLLFGNPLVVVVLKYLSHTFSSSSWWSSVERKTTESLESSRSQYYDKEISRTKKRKKRESIQSDE